MRTVAADYRCCVPAQAAVAALLQLHFDATQQAPQLAPLRCATPLVLLCAGFEPRAYLATQPTATQLCCDVRAVHSWLADLAACRHSLSSCGGGDDGSGSCSSSAASAADTRSGLVVAEVSAAKTAMSNTATSALT